MNNKPNLTDEEKTAIIDEAVSRIREVNNTREDKEIRRQAMTQQALDGLEGTSPALENLIDNVYGGN